jgi:hypothetical protein
MYSYFTGFGRLINSPIKTSLISTIGVLEAENIITSYPNVPITPNPLVRDMGPEVTGLNNLISSNIIFP